MGLKEFRKEEHQEPLIEMDMRGQPSVLMCAAPERRPRCVIAARTQRDARAGVSRPRSRKSATKRIARRSEPSALRATAEAISGSQIARPM
jgi:hypothetical protein